MNKQVKFDELNFQLFVAGELEIISEKDLSSTEKSGRIALLKKLVYYYATYELKGLKAFYAAWLREIELGKKTWSDNSSHIENAILSKYLLKGTTKSKSTPASKSLSGQSSHGDERVWFCPLYQRNKCFKNQIMLIPSRTRVLNCCSTFVQPAGLRNRKSSSILNARQAARI